MQSRFVQSRFIRSGLIAPIFTRSVIAPPAVLTTVSFIASTTATAASITAPASINAGDLLVMFDGAITNAGPVPTSVVPTGFTQILELNDGGSARNIWSYKIAVGNEDGTSITGMDGANTDRKAILQFRGDAPISSVTVQDIGSQITDGDPAAQVVNASGGVVPLIVFAGYRATANITARDFTPAEDAEIFTAPNQGFVKYKIYNSSPADVTGDMPDSSSNDNALTSFYLELT